MFGQLSFSVDDSGNGALLHMCATLHRFGAKDEYSMKVLTDASMGASVRLARFVFYINKPHHFTLLDGFPMTTSNWNFQVNCSLLNFGIMSELFITDNRLVHSDRELISLKLDTSRLRTLTCS